MQTKIIHWLGREFVTLSCEGRSRGKADEETRDIFRRCEAELNVAGLSLQNTVRTRLWARDRQSRDMASSERVKILSGKARASSSSFISPGHFDSEALIALDLLALKTPQRHLQKEVKENDPPRNFIRYLSCDSLVFISGVTSDLPTLSEQVAQILQGISNSLSETESSWEQVVNISFFLHRSQNLESLKELFGKIITAPVPQREYVFVDGYSAEGKLIEIEVTAELPAKSI